MIKKSTEIMKGIGVSKGIAIGKAYVIKKNTAALSGAVVSGGDIIIEIEKFDIAVKRSVEELERTRENKGLGLKEEEVQILEAHIELLMDPQIREDVVAKIENEKKTSNDALIEVINEIVAVFKNMHDEYMSARAADVEDIGSRLLKNLNPAPDKEDQPEKDTIVIADDMTPSDTLTLDLNLVNGFATISGGRTSHAAIIAKSRGVPAVVGVGEEMNRIVNNDLVIVDGTEGLVLVNPGSEIIDNYKKRREEYLIEVRFLKSLKGSPAVTLDGINVKLTANISSADDLGQALNSGAEGAGLFRTELLFMGKDSFPTEDEQFEFYKKAALKSGGVPMIIRTIDVGGDKPIPYFNIEAEANPFLGYRAIRICLDRKDIFITQLKAILRASVFGELKIMFPMISGVEELKAAKQVLIQAKNELNDEKRAFNENIQVGIMIEIPSAAITADILAKEVDFFSIGTNDLCQYTLAVDRMNEKISDLYDPFHPGVLRLIQNVIEQGHKNHIHVGMCGEMASDPLATLLLLGMGLDEFSMSAPSVPYIKNIIINNKMSFAKEVYKNVMQMDNAQSIKNYLKEVTA
jgi:phosphotransferase system enzyme I (PtsI)